MSKPPGLASAATAPRLCPGVGDGSGLWTVPPRIRVLVPGLSEGALVWPAPRQPPVCRLDEGHFLFQDKSEVLSGANIQTHQLRGWSG